MYIIIHNSIHVTVYLVNVGVQDLTALVADFGLARMFHPLEKKESNKSNGRSRGSRRRWAARYCWSVRQWRVTAARPTGVSARLG